MSTIVPIISSGTAGPLGVLHLPRLWTKLTLAAAGKLPSGYDMCGNGFDGMTISALHLDREAVIAYVTSEKPTYVQFEAWILAQNGGAIDRESVDANNAAVLGYKHEAGLAGSIRSAAGSKDEHVGDAVTLNMLDDLHALHASLIA